MRRSTAGVRAIEGLNIEQRSFRMGSNIGQAASIFKVKYLLLWRSGLAHQSYKRNLLHGVPIMAIWRSRVRPPAVAANHFWSIRLTFCLRSTSHLYCLPHAEPHFTIT